jgi:hypothetical protein
VNKFLHLIRVTKVTILAGLLKATPTFAEPQARRVSEVLIHCFETSNSGHPSFHRQERHRSHCHLSSSLPPFPLHLRAKPQTQQQPFILKKDTTIQLELILLRHVAWEIPILHRKITRAWEFCMQHLQSLENPKICSRE